MLSLGVYNMSSVLKITGETKNCLVNCLIVLAVNQYRLHEEEPHFFTAPDFSFIIQNILMKKYQNTQPETWQSFLDQCTVKQAEIIIATAVRSYLDDNHEDISKYSINIPNQDEKVPLAYHRSGDELDDILLPYLIRKLQLKIDCPFVQGQHQDSGFNTFKPHGSNPYQFHQATEEKLPEGVVASIQHSGRHFDLSFIFSNQQIIDDNPQDDLMDLIEAIESEDEYFQKRTGLLHKLQSGPDSKNIETQLQSITAILAMLENNPGMESEIAQQKAEQIRMQKIQQQLTSDQQELERLSEQLPIIKAQIISKASEEFLTQYFPTMDYTAAIPVTESDDENQPTVPVPETTDKDNPSTQPEEPNNDTPEAQPTETTDKDNPSTQPEEPNNNTPETQPAVETDENNPQTILDRTSSQDHKSTFWSRLVAWFSKLLKAIKNWAFNIGKPKPKPTSSDNLDSSRNERSADHPSDNSFSPPVQDHNTRPRNDN